MRIITILLAVVFQISAFGQSNAEVLLKEAKSLYRKGDYEASGKKYEEYFINNSGWMGEAYDAACSWSLAGDSEKGIFYLRRAVTKGWYNSDHMRRDKDLNSLHSHSDWPFVLKQADDNRDKLEASYQQPLSGKLIDLYYRDQVLRQLLDEAEKKFGRNTREMQAYWDFINREDQRLFEELDALLKEYGWPARSKVGGQANAAAFLILQHAPLEQQEEFLPLMEESVKNKESQGSHFAMLYDRVSLRQGKPQRYGTQVDGFGNGQYELPKLEDPSKVDEWRAEVGLGPLSVYLKRYNITWPPKK